MSDNHYKWPDKVILIAEDEMINFMLLNKVLESTASKVFWAKNGLEAVALNQERNPDVILMDLRMPEMNGIDATKAIRKTHPHLPIVAVTAFALDNEAQQCQDAGCSAFLTKPVRPVILYELLEKLFAG
jgi:two-component system, cell cycle response regulator DivK